MALQRIMLSIGLLALIGVGLFSPCVALAQTNRAPRSRNTPQRKLSARQIAQRTSPSVVLLVTADEGDTPIALGSGFFVQSNVIATANHVIKDAPQIYAKIAGRRASYKISFIGSADEKNDLVLLRIDDVKGQPLKLGNLSRLQVGDEIYVMGNPEGLEGTFSRGNVSAIRNSKGLIQITAPISHGSSGGPVLDERGEGPIKPDWLYNFHRFKVKIESLPKQARTCLECGREVSLQVTWTNSPVMPIDEAAIIGCDGVIDEVINAILLEGARQGWRLNDCFEDKKSKAAHFSVARSQEQSHSIHAATRSE